MSKDIKSHITAPELQELLRFIIDENKFFEYDKAKVAAKIKDASKPKKGPNGVVEFQPRIADAATTEIYVKADGKENEASRYALGMMFGPQKNIEELKQLVAIKNRLQRVMVVAHAGGPVEVAKIVKQANMYLKKKYPTAKPFDKSHLTSAAVRADGSKFYYFSRYKKGTDGTAKTATYTNVRMTFPVKGEPKIMVNAKLK